LHHERCDQQRFNRRTYSCCSNGNDRSHSIQGQVEQAQLGKLQIAVQEEYRCRGQPRHKQYCATDFESRSRDRVQMPDWRSAEEYKGAEEKTPHYLHYPHGVVKCGAVTSLVLYDVLRKSDIRAQFDALPDRIDDQQYAEELRVQQP
jgi:hypothetical protein